jgi:hypothetical protein
MHFQFFTHNKSSFYFKLVHVLTQIDLFWALFCQTQSLESQNLQDGSCEVFHLLVKSAVALTLPEIVYCNTLQTPCSHKGIKWNFRK